VAGSSFGGRRGLFLSESGGLPTALRRHPTRSLDLIPFGGICWPLGELLGLSKRVRETGERFTAALNEVAEAGQVRNAVRSMPRRLKYAIECDGHAAPWYSVVSNDAGRTGGRVLPR